jgi:hypothetical protein
MDTNRRKLLQTGSLALLGVTGIAVRRTLWTRSPAFVRFSFSL